MKKEKPRTVDVDELLKDALQDDLPAEAERRMQRRLAQFRERIEQPEHQPETSALEFWQKLFGLRDRIWVRRLFTRAVLAYSSMFMLAVGGFLQVTGHLSALAESLTSLRTSVSVADSVRHKGFMECRIEIPAKDEAPADYIIRWLPPNTTRVDAQRGEEFRETLLITSDGVVVVDHLKNTSQKFESLEQIHDSLFQPVMGFLSPAMLAENIDQRWQLGGFEQKTGSHQGTLTFINHEKASVLKMAVDLGTFLPVHISKSRVSGEKGGREEEVMRIDFAWDQPVSPQRMIPETQGKNGSLQ
jgi:hypothetical protein